MVSQAVPKRKKLAANSENYRTTRYKKIKFKPEAITTLPRNPQRTQPKSNKLLAKVQKALRNSQAKARRERRARIQVEQALIEARKELATIRLETKQEHQLQIRRVSFVVRLILDERSQFERTEIEHVSSSKKQNFLNLDGEQLIAFMKACIKPLTSRDPDPQEP